MGDPIVLPREIIVPLASEPTIDLEVLARDGKPSTWLDGEDARPACREIDLKKQLIGLFITIVVHQLRNDGCPCFVDDDRILPIDEGHELPYVAERYGDGFRRTGHR
jgi:hypothetical protein